MKKITIIDNQFAHGTSLGSGDLPLHPKNFTWYRGSAWESKYIFITETSFDKIEYVIPSERRIAFIVEPRSINQFAYDFVSANHHRFAYVLSHDKEFLKTIPNGLYYPFGGCWIRPEERRIYPKTKLISIIASEKNHTDGHRLRHDIILKYGDLGIDVYGRGYNPVENKIEALKDYCYSIVIENEKSPGWFTEKLIDCLQTGTIPIYWGAPDIHDYFNGVKGFLNADKLEELLIHNKNNPGEMFNYYKENKDVERMFELSKKYVCPEDWMYENYPQLFI